MGFEDLSITCVPLKSRIFNSRFANSINNPGTDKVSEKSRLAIQTYKYDGKTTVLTQSPNIQRVSQHIILAIAASLRKKNQDIELYPRGIS